MQATHQELANAIRFLSIDAVEAAKSGHPGMPMGMADVATVLFQNFLKFDAKNPHWPDRDRFILSAGHGSMLLYALLYLTGYEDMTLDEIKRFRQLGSITAGHPEYGYAAGIETTTGPLGQGIANSVGFALAERILNARFRDELVNHYTYVIASDGDLMEGISHEAISMAGHLKLNKLIVLFDDNDISIDGPTSLSVSDDQLKRFDASGWNTMRIDGHDPKAIASAIEKAKKSDKPTLIACKTIIGYGSPNKQGTKDCHGSPLGADETQKTRDKLGWSYAPFEIPTHILNGWRAIGAKGGKAFADWQAQLQKSDPTLRGEFERVQKGLLPNNFGKAIMELKAKWIAEKPKIATRVASGQVLEILQPLMPELVGGSADLTPSNNTKVKQHVSVTPGNYNGQYVHFGVREHGMCAAMNGMALHGGIIPYGGTFLVFTDYCRPSIRLAALMGKRVVFVMTHDSIGLGEDGPTHQPVEHYAALRAIPNLLFIRPCDAVETAEAWEVALQQLDRPSVIALTRQNVAALRVAGANDNGVLKGAYELRGTPNPQVSLFASGSEVEIAMAAADELTNQGIDTRVVSVPSWELFAEQTEQYQQNTIGYAKVNIAVEAGIRQGWDRFIGNQGGFVGMSSFGASAPYQDAYKHFGITAENVVKLAKEKL